jgi:hypothetical protein
MQTLVLFEVMWILLQISLGISPQVFKICSNSSQGSPTISSMFSLVDLLFRGYMPYPYYHPMPPPPPSEDDE